MWGWLGLVARAVTGAVWIWAGCSKISHPYAAVLAVRAYQLLPGGVAEVIGHVLPTLEVVVGVALVVGVLTRFVAAISALLFVAFIVGIASVWARGILIDCGCFGGGGFDPHAADKYPWEIARDAALLLCSLFLVVVGNSRWSLDRLIFRTTAAGGTGTVEED
ncbi:MauE/DoxX family redox-associated membrane protein [Nocardioides sp. Kera G14]|uniref:MauE/DoxX family redox-associated membrane protein n=1 Tax=Nocardioides sp. Kera G14 TaxID=2884264 RepID=UPI001D122BED|nr:MauE/DoxX family redox-associated membrane protein [Nocardioides sp. Kera G14]UDY24440.1 DoxX family membrane protein [Nocardioides sp. Kera G14]